jgi:hypothetical protein
MQDKKLRFVVKCVHCGKGKNMHRAFSLDCPTGKRTRTGYTTFGPQRFRAADEEPARRRSKARARAEAQPD